MCRQPSAGLVTQGAPWVLTVIEPDPFWVTVSVRLTGPGGMKPSGKMAVSMLVLGDHVPSRQLNVVIGVAQFSISSGDAEAAPATSTPATLNATVAQACRIRDATLDFSIISPFSDAARL
jgi:hypothetical protein